MKTRIELGGGSWAEMKPIEEVTNGTRKAAIKAYDIAGGSGFSKDYAAWDLLLADMVTAWSYELPLPKNDAGALDQIPMEDANVLYGHLKAVVTNLFPSFSPSPDPKVRIAS